MELLNTEVDSLSSSFLENDETLDGDAGLYNIWYELHMNALNKYFFSRLLG
jgi:hypothetical protein